MNKLNDILKTFQSEVANGTYDKTMPRVSKRHKPRVLPTILQEHSSLELPCHIVANRKPNKQGYISTTIRGTPHLYHEYVWCNHMDMDEVPNGSKVVHKCGNGACANPDHLDIVKL